MNTFCYSKINFLSQVFKIDSKVIREIKTKALQFVYVGYNERPVQVLNFRGREEGGLGRCISSLDDGFGILDEG